MRPSCGCAVLLQCHNYRNGFHDTRYNISDVERALQLRDFCLCQATCSPEARWCALFGPNVDVVVSGQSDHEIRGHGNIQSRFQNCPSPPTEDMEGKGGTAVGQQLPALLRSRPGLIPPLFWANFETCGIDQILPRAHFPATRHSVPDLTELCHTWTTMHSYTSRYQQHQSLSFSV